MLPCNQNSDPETPYLSQLIIYTYASLCRTRISSIICMRLPQDIYSLTFTRKLMKLDEDNKQIMCSLTMRLDAYKHFFQIDSLYLSFSRMHSNVCLKFEAIERAINVYCLHCLLNRIHHVIKMFEALGRVRI